MLYFQRSPKLSGIGLSAGSRLRSVLRRRAGIYLSRGYIAPGLAMPVMLGVLTGSLVGARQLLAARAARLRVSSAVVVGALAVRRPDGGTSLADSLLQSLLGNVLRAGVTAAAAIVLACGAWYLAESGGRTADYRTFRSVTCSRGLDPLALIQLGLFLLIATPVARVM
jgi:hypothetical protein